MRAHIAAIKAMLAPTGRTVYVGDVPATPTYPYVLLWASPGKLDAPAVCGTQDHLHDRFGVTYVGLTTDSVFAVSAACRPLLLNQSPTVADRYVQPLRLFDTEVVKVDRDVVEPQTGAHPQFAVDLFTLISEPV